MDSIEIKKILIKSTKRKDITISAIVLLIIFYTLGPISIFINQRVKICTNGCYNTELSSLFTVTIVAMFFGIGLAYLVSNYTNHFYDRK